MIAAIQCQKRMSLNASLKHCGIPKTTWYRRGRQGKKRDVRLDSVIARTVRVLGHKRPSYGTRMMAAAVSRKLGVPINRKRIQRIYRKTGWIEPKKTKKEIIKRSQTRFRPTAPDQLWAMDITHMQSIRDGNCYCFNVVDVFTREWIAYVFDTTMRGSNAIDALVAAVASRKPSKGLILRSDNGTQFTSREFVLPLKELGITQERIGYRSPEQNGHIESFHGTLKREYVWPNDFESFQEAEDAMATAFDDYNHHRIHSAVGYVPPAEFAAGLTDGNNAETPQKHAKSGTENRGPHQYDYVV